MRSERCDPLGFARRTGFGPVVVSLVSYLVYLILVINFQYETTQVLPVVQGSSELSTTREWTFDLNCDACVRLFVCYCFPCIGVLFNDCELLLWYI